MNYLLHAGLILAACFVYYWFFLRSETHFRLNRWVLLSCIGAAFLLPLLTVPAAWSLRQPTPVVELELPAEAAPTQATTPPPAPPSLAAAVTTSRADSIIEAALKAAGQPTLAEVLQESDSNAVAGTPTSLESTSSSITPNLETVRQATNWPRLLGWIYLAGLFVFGLHFLFQLGLLVFRMLRQPGYEFDGFRIIELPYKIAPYSFWNRIFLNPTDYDPDTFHQIVEHERIHITQRHSLDILLAELLVVVQWCNPFAWLYRWAVEHNLEFLTDSEMLAKGTDRVNYQMNLVKVSVPNLPQGLTSNYNQTFLKKRIQMMNSKKSTARSGWKYLALMPVLLLSVLQFNAVAQTPASPVPQTSIEPQAPSPNPTPQPNPTPDLSAATTPITDIAIDAQPTPITDPVVSTPMAIDVEPELDMDMDPMPTPEFHIEIPAGQGSRRSWTAEIEGSEICFQFIVDWDERGNHHSNTSECLPLSELGDLPRGNMGDFELSRYAGTMTFKGVFDGNTGVGTFDYEPSNQLVGYLTSEGFGDYEWMEYLHFFYADFEPSFLAYLKQEGYTPGSQRLLELMVFNFDEANFRAALEMIENNGFDKPGLQKMIELHIFDITPEYIGELASAGFEDLSLQQIIEASIHDLDAELVREMAQAGFDNLRFREVLEMAIHNVDADYVSQLRAAGYDPSARRLVEAKIHNVTPDYAQQLAEAGFDNLSLQNVIEASIHNLDGEFVEQMANAGFTDLEFREMLEMAIHNVSFDYVEELRAAGFDPSARQIAEASIHNVDPAFVAEMARAGFENLSFDELIGASIHNLDADFVQDMASIGFDNLSFDQLMGMSIHNVSADYVRQLRAAGFTPDADEVVAATIHHLDPDLPKVFNELGYDDLSFDDLLSASVHNVTPGFVRSFEEFEFRDLSFDDLMGFRIHNVTPGFIRRNLEDGDSPDDFIQMKIHGRRR